MSWFIDASVNEGYPCNTGFPESYTYKWSDPVNPKMWRIESGINEGYPFLGLWFGGSDVGEGDMEIGGGQTNFPNGFTDADVGGIDDQFNDDDMGLNDTLINVVNENLGIALTDKMFSVS